LSPAAGGPEVAELSALVRNGVLTQQQADRLASAWGAIGVDAWAQPCLREVREHTRAYVEVLQVRSAGA
jgi:hypothetical protein